MEELVGKVGAIEANKGELSTNQATKNKLKDMLTDVCRQNILTHQIRREEAQDNRAIPYNIGDLVRIRLNDVQKKRLGGKKISPRNSEPYLIVEKWGDWTYLMVKLSDKDCRDAKKVRRHFNELVPCRRQDEQVDECYWIKLGVNHERAQSELKKPAQVKTASEEDKSLHQDLNQQEAPRRSARERRPVQRLQMDWKGKKYRDTSDELIRDEEESEASSETDEEDAEDPTLYE